MLWPSPGEDDQGISTVIRRAEDDPGDGQMISKMSRLLEEHLGSILFHGKRHPKDMGEPEIAAFLTSLVVEGDVAVATQQQALNAIVFLYSQVLDRELGDFSEFRRARRRRKLPVVLTQEEVFRLLGALQWPHSLFGALLYGTGMRLMEGVRLRVKDLDFSRRLILVRDGKGACLDSSWGSGSVCSNALAVSERGRPRHIR